MKKQAFAALTLASTIVFFTVLYSPEANAGPYPLPSLKLSQLADGRVLVRWSISGGVIQKKNKLTIGRSLRLIGPFTNVKTVKYPARRGRFIDDAGKSGIVHYQPFVEMSKNFKVGTRIFSISLDGTPYTPGQGEPALAPGQNLCPAGSREQLLTLINSQRTSPSLAYNEKLQWAAQAQAIEIADAEIDTDSGFMERIVQAGFLAHSYAGVTYRGGTDPSEPVSAWLQSGSTSCGGINYSKNRYGAGGCVIDSAGVIWWTFAFGEQP